MNKRVSYISMQGCEKSSSPEPSSAYAFTRMKACTSSRGRAVDESDEIQKTWRLLARDLAYWDKDRTSVRKITCSPKYQPPAEQCFNAEALVHKTDRDPLDILLRRSKALAAYVAAERTKAALADGDGFSAGQSIDSCGVWCGTNLFGIIFASREKE